MGFKKYVRKQGRRVKAYAKKRYMPAGKVDFQRIASDVLKIKGLINSELKHKDYTLPSTILAPTGSSWNIQLLNGLEAQDGDRGGEREGMKVRFKSLQVRGRVFRSQPTNGEPHRVRMIVFIDKEPLVSGLAVAPPATELLWPNTTGSLINALRNWDSVGQKRFTVLHDRTYVLSDDYPEKQYKFYKKLDMTTNWQNGYIAADAINNNALYVAFMTDTPVGEDSIRAEYQSRLTYRDN